MGLNKAERYYIYKIINKVSRQIKSSWKGDMKSHAFQYVLKIRRLEKIMVDQFRSSNPTHFIFTPDEQRITGLWIPVFKLEELCLIYENFTKFVK